MAAAIVELEENARKERYFAPRFNPLEDLADFELKKKYRFGREGIVFIVDFVKEEIEPFTARNQSISPTLQVLVALNFFATGSYLDSVASLHGIHRATASRIIHRVAKALCRNKSKVIKFPTKPEEVAKAKEGFYRVAGFPRVVGVIDCTHVGMHGIRLTERKEDEHIYTNRKGRTTMNVQLVCDADFRITSVLARWPGNTHDSRILQNSKLYKKFNDGQAEGILLGDSGYPLRKWLMTPLLNPQTDAEHAYNRAQIRTRALIEQLNGQIKNKFRCLLGHGMQMKPNRVCFIITACCVLFNISKQLQEPALEDREEVMDEEEDEAEEDEGDGHREVGDAGDVDGIAARAEMVNLFAL